MLIVPKIEPLTFDQYVQSTIEHLEEMHTIAKKGPEEDRLFLSVRNLGATDQTIDLFQSYGDIYGVNDFSSTYINSGKSISTGTNSIDCFVHPVTGNTYVVNFGSDSVSVINTSNTLVDTISIPGGGPEGIGYSPITGYIYIANRSNDTISVVDSNNDIIDTINIGQSVEAIVYSPTTQCMYICGLFDAQVLVMDATNTVIDTIPVGSGPEDLAYNSGNGNIYVANSGDDTVSIIDPTNTVIDTIGVGSAPTGIRYNSSNRNMYISNFGDGTVSVLDENNVAGTPIPVGTAPNGVTYNSGNGNIYVANTTSNTISVINQNNEVIDTISNVGIGSLPAGIAYNAFNGIIYISNFGSASATYLTPSTPIPTGSISYPQMARQIASNPILVRYAKLVGSSFDVINQVVKFQYANASSLTESYNINLSQYVDDENNKQPVVNLEAMKDIVLSGNQGFQLNLPAGQSITMVIIYKKPPLQLLMEGKLDGDFISRYNHDVLYKQETTLSSGYQDKSLVGITTRLQNLKNKGVYECEVLKKTVDKVAFVGSKLNTLKSRIYAE